MCRDRVGHPMKSALRICAANTGTRIAYVSKWPRLRRPRQRYRDNVHVAARPPRPHLDHDVETAAPLILRQNPGSRFPKKAFAAVCERARRRLRVSTAVGDFSVSMAWNWHDTAVREAYPIVVAVWGTKACSTAALMARRGEVVRLDNASLPARRLAFH